MTYQPSWRDGREITPGTRESSSRYDALYPVVEHLSKKLGRTVTILDVGTNDGYFPLRLVEDFDCHVTALDKKLPPLKSSKRITPVTQNLTADNARNLPRYDLILALSVLHHFPNWREMWPILRQRAKYGLIAEVPHPDEKLRYAAARKELDALWQEVQSQALTQLGTASATRQPELSRDTLYVPSLIVGTPFGGSGSNSRFQKRYREGFIANLPYIPYMGSLNLRIGFSDDLDAPDIDMVVGKNRDYQFWNARIVGLSAPVHIMRPGKRGWPNAIELVSSVRLRDHIEPDQEVHVEVLP